MKINKNKLQQALEVVKPGLANKEIIEQTTSFAFMKGHVVTYNDDISLSHPVEGLGIEGAVKADELYELLRKLKGDEIELVEKENEILITAGRSKAGLVVQAEIKLPLEEIGRLKGWKPLPEDFLNGLAFCTPTCGRDLTRPVLMAVHVNQGGFIEGSDSLRIAHYGLKDRIPVNTFLFPAAAASQLLRLQNIREMTESRGWINFRTEAGTIFSSRVYEDKFPDTKSFLNVSGVEGQFPLSILRIIGRAEALAKRDDILNEEVEITMKGRRCEIRAVSETGSWFEEIAKLETAVDEKISMKITPCLFKDILSKTTQYVRTENSLKFEGDSWIYVICLTV